MLNKKDSLRALREAGPRSREGFAALVERHAGMRDTIVRIEPATTGHMLSTSRAARPVAKTGRSPRPTRRVVRLSAGAALVVAAATVVTVLLVGGGTPDMTPAPALAAEAVKKAAVDTTAAAKSGVIDTTLVIDGEARVVNKLSWNGADVALIVENDEQRQLRYVKGLYYETYGYSEALRTGDDTRHGEWIHISQYDHGGTNIPEGIDSGNIPVNEETAPALWLTAARTDLAGAGLVEFVTSVRDYTRVANDDGSASYAAVTTVAAIQSEDWSLAGLPAASRPSFKVADTRTPVAVKVTVGANGLIRELKLDWRLDVPGEAKDWSYTTTYSQLGSAAAIAAPDPSHTITTDTRFPKSAPGPM